MTIKQKDAISKVVENRGNISKSMRQAGYADKTAKNPKNLTESNAWKEAMASIDYGKHLRQLEELADIKKNTDKDNVLKSKKMLFDIGDKFPVKGVKISGIEEVINRYRT